MNEASYENIKISLLLSKTNPSMSEAEAIESCKIYFTIISSNNINNLLILELENKQDTKQKSKETETLKLLNIWLNRLALTKEAHILIGSAEVKKEQPEIQINKEFSITSPLIKELAKEEKNPTFKISTRNTGISEGKEKKKKTITIEDFAKALANKGFHKTDMHFPNLEFMILNTGKTFLGIKLWTNTNSFEKRKAHLRPVLHPTAINPKLARAMINLAGVEKEILDPFCGMGGTLLEASIIGLKAMGTDISPEMIARARLNFQDEESKKNIVLYEMDALKWKNRTECVITDFPYGKSSKLNSSIAELIDMFLAHYSSLTKKAVLCFPEGTAYTLPKNWKKIYDFKIYIHKSLTRNIIVLENSATI